MALLQKNIENSLEKLFLGIAVNLNDNLKKTFDTINKNSEHSLSVLHSLFEESSGKLNDQLLKWDELLKEQDAIITASTRNIEILPATVLENLYSIKEVTSEISTYSNNWTAAVSSQKNTVSEISKMLKETIPKVVHSVNDSQNKLKEESAKFENQVEQLTTQMKSGLFDISSSINHLNLVIGKSIEENKQLNTVTTKQQQKINENLSRLANDIDNFRLIANSKFNEPVKNFDSNIQALTKTLATLDQHVTNITNLNGDMKKIQKHIGTINTHLTNYHSEIGECCELFRENSSKLETVVTGLNQIINSKVFD